MNPKVYTISTNENLLFTSIVDCISSFDSSNFFSDHIGSTQQEQRTQVRLFQYALLGKLQTEIDSINWVQEYSPHISKGDKIDIYGEKDNIAVAIELDKWRADQVAKKFVSRTALLENKDLYYISVCYSGTEKMSFTECVKYYDYCFTLSKKMTILYAGLALR